MPDYAVSWIYEALDDTLHQVIVRDSPDALQALMLAVLNQETDQTQAELDKGRTGRHGGILPTKGFCHQALRNDLFTAVCTNLHTDKEEPWWELSPWHLQQETRSKLAKVEHAITQINVILDGWEVVADIYSMPGGPGSAQQPTVQNLGVLKHNLETRQKTLQSVCKQHEDSYAVWTRSIENYNQSVRDAKTGGKQEESNVADE